MSTSEARKIRLGDGSTITIYLNLDWLEVPLETLATIRAAVDVLVSLHVEPEPKAPTAELRPTNLVVVDPPAEAPASEHACDCDVEGCGRTFGSLHALAVHKSRSHKAEPASDPSPPAEAPAGEPIEDSAIVNNAVLTYTCATCWEKTDNYTKLAEHTMGWHRRHPTQGERNGLEPDDPENEEPTPEVAGEPETPAVHKEYVCDDCTWTSQDGRELFKHTGKAHGRQPRTWERQRRLASERVS